MIIFLILYFFSVVIVFGFAPFCFLPALDILGCLPDVDCCGKVEEEVYINREAIIEWIYGLQTLPTVIATVPPTQVTTETTTTDADEDEKDKDRCTSYKYIGGGFKGGTFLGPLPNASSTSTTTHEQQSNAEKERQQQRHAYDHSHLAMTYVALCTLVALGDDLSRIHKTAILQTLQALQKEDGSFMAVSWLCRQGGEDSATTLTSTEQQNPIDDTTVDDDDDDDCDLRFMYTAIVIWYLLSNQTDDSTQPRKQQQNHTINIESATSYILSCISYDGALALTPGREGHGGSTFCGIASLFLMGVLEEVMAREELAGWKDNLIRWCVMRQHSLPNTNLNSTITDEEATNGYNMEGGITRNNAAGMQGRPNKLEDTCYSYWIGGTLHLLRASQLLDGWALREYVLECQSPIGGFGKVLGAMPDLLHSFYSLAWLSLSNEQQCCYDDGRTGSSSVDGTYYDEHIRKEVTESMNQLSRLDCALGMCSKRVKEMWHLGSRGPKYDTKNGGC